MIDHFLFRRKEHSAEGPLLLLVHLPAVASQPDGRGPAPFRSPGQILLRALQDSLHCGLLAQGIQKLPHLHHESDRHRLPCSYARYVSDITVLVLPSILNVKFANFCS